MGTKVHFKNSFYSMKNVDEDSNNSSWHLFNALTNDHYYDGFTPRTVTNAYLGHEKDELKQKMLQHEDIFKNQVYELHRLYRRQRDMMEEVKRKEFDKSHISIDTWHDPSFPLGNFKSRPSIFGAEISNSPLSCSKGNDSKNYEIAECRPSKIRKKLFDLQLPAHENIEPESDNRASEISSYKSKENGFLIKNGVKTFLDSGGKKDGQHFMWSNGLADLNEPVYGQDVDFFGPSAKPAGFGVFSSCLREPGNSRTNMKSQTPSDTMQRLHGKDVQHRGLYSEISSQIQDRSRFNQTPLLFSSTSAYPCWSHTGPSWGKSNDSLTHKLTSYQTQPSFLSSPRSHNVFSDKQHRNGNGFYNGSKELSARLPSVGFDYRKCNKLDDGSRKIFKDSNFIDFTGTTKVMDLNIVQTLSNEDEKSRKCDKTLPPWLKAKPVIKEKDELLDINKKLLGFPISANSKNDDSSIEHRGIDINIAWDDVSAYEHIEKPIDLKTDEEIKNFKNRFDLNSCVTEDDELLVTESVKSSKMITMEIDLEAPIVSEIDEDNEHDENNELAKIAAEAIVSIASQHDHDKIEDPLLWFVEVVDPCEKNIVSAIREPDEYEMLTLELEETKEEDYMPTLSVPDYREPDEVGPTLTSSRPRRGQSRRGRPRRDFQRDILPGLTSLSRHEITEDVQVFGGLMRATGHTWNVKRIGSRGRRKVKAVELSPAATSPPPPPLLPPLLSKQVKNVEMVGLDERRLTGWGKTTRRPRRQRCAAGNSVAVQLT